MHVEIDAAARDLRRRCDGVGAGGVVSDETDSDRSADFARTGARSGCRGGNWGASAASDRRAWNAESCSRFDPESLSKMKSRVWEPQMKADARRGKGFSSTNGHEWKAIQTVALFVSIRDHSWIKPYLCGFKLLKRYPHALLLLPKSSAPLSLISLARSVPMKSSLLRPPLILSAPVPPSRSSSPASPLK